MKAECGICEYKGNLISAPSFVCFNCGDAIKRLVWIRDREQDRSNRFDLRARVDAAGACLPNSAVSGK
jgi:hypothetical protein